MLGKERHTPVGPTQTKEQAEREDRTVILAGLLHDIGSLAVPKNRYSVLAKISCVVRAASMPLSPLDPRTGEIDYLQMAVS